MLWKLMSKLPSFSFVPLQVLSTKASLKQDVLQKHYSNCAITPKHTPFNWSLITLDYSLLTTLYWISGKSLQSGRAEARGTSGPPPLPKVRLQLSLWLSLQPLWLLPPAWTILPILSFRFSVFLGFKFCSKSTCIMRPPRSLQPHATVLFTDFSYVLHCLCMCPFPPLPPWQISTQELKSEIAEKRENSSTGCFAIASK